MFVDAVTELAGFVASFLSIGAIGFRYAIRRRHDDEIVWHGARRAALLGLIGSLVTLGMFLFLSLPQAAARKHTTVLHAITGNQQTLLQAGGWIAAIVFFALAAANVRASWPFAAVGVIVGSLAPLFVGQFLRAVNPIHRFAAGMWIGTLFVLVVAGLNTVLRETGDKIERGRIAADLIDTFSPLALGSFGLLAASGVVTAWRHLKHLNALWTTSYGYALIAKLCVVAVVIALGAFNWRRQRPLLGSESAAAVLRRSATWELAAAGVVLLITAVLVSLPSPR
jgi:putative copper resistance protein D